VGVYPRLLASSRADDDKLSPSSGTYAPRGTVALSSADRTLCDRLLLHYRRHYATSQGVMTENEAKEATAHDTSEAEKDVDIHVDCATGAADQGSLDEAIAQSGSGETQDKRSKIDHALEVRHISDASSDGDSQGSGDDSHELIAVESARLTIPIGAIRLVSTASLWYPGGLLLLATDKGHGHPACFAGQPDPEAARHGSVSFMVNFHALAMAVHASGGASWQSGAEHASTKLFAAVLLPGDRETTALVINESDSDTDSVDSAIIALHAV